MTNQKSLKIKQQYTLIALRYINTDQFVYAFKELPDDLQKKIRKSKLDTDQIDKHFDVLCNVLRFTTKRQIIRNTESEHKSSSNDKQEPKHDSSESNLPAWMLKDAGIKNLILPNFLHFYRRTYFLHKP